MRVTIYQPQYFPRLHYFNRILNSDVFVILDNAQYVKGLRHEGSDKRHKSYQSDGIIKISTGTQYLTVPVKKSGYPLLNEISIAYGTKWRRVHRMTLQTAYGGAAYYRHWKPSVNALIDGHYPHLAAFTTATILWGIGAVVCNREDGHKIPLEEMNALLKKDSTVRLSKIVLSSELGVPRPEGRQQGTAWTIAICKALGAAEYYHGGTAKDGYMEDDAYLSEGIKPVVQDWQCQQYSQQFMDKVAFLPSLSIVDLMFNVKQKNARILLTGS